MTDIFLRKNSPNALLDAYKNRDLTALLMAICQNSMFDLLRNSFLAPFRFNADGQENPVFLTDEKGNFLREKGIHVSDRDYDRFRRIYREKQGVKMYLAYGYRKRHAYDEDNHGSGRVQNGRTYRCAAGV